MKTAPVKDFLGKHRKDLIKDISRSTFSLMVDGSNDAGLENMFPISISIFDLSFNWIRTKFFDINMSEAWESWQNQSKHWRA